MFRNEILGLACLGDRIDSCLLVKQGKHADGPSWEPDLLRSQTLTVHEHQEETEVLRQILTALAPSRRRAICLGIARRRYLMREIPCPGCTVDEAIASIRLSLDHYLPLSCEDVYCDLLARERNGVASVQLYWVERRYVEALVAAIQTTGHIRSLVTVAPLCYGLDLYLRSCGQEHLPGSFVSMQTRLPVVTFHSAAGFAGSLPLRLDAKQRPKLDLPSLELKMAETFALPLRILCLRGDSTHVPAPVQQFLTEAFADQDLMSSCLLDIENWGQCAAMLAVSCSTMPHFHPGKRRMRREVGGRLFLRLAVVVLLAVLAAAARNGWEARALRDKAEGLEVEAKRAQQRHSLLASGEKDLLDNKKFYDDVSTFRLDCVELLGVLKSLAEQTPVTTWVPSLHLNERNVTVEVVGTGAADILELWGKIPYVAGVRLASQVNKDRDGQERFRVEFQLQRGE